VVREKILRVHRTKEQAKRNYDRISRIYDCVFGQFERKFRDMGLEKLDVKDGEIVLEAGFGTGHCLAEIAKKVGNNGKTYGIDISSGMLEVTRKRLEKEGIADKVDLYCEQGLIQNARRILEGLKTKYPDDPKIQQKIAILDDIRTKVKEHEIPERIDKVEVMEAKVEKGEIKRSIEQDEKVTAFDIFAETDIIPIGAQETGEKIYYDLAKTVKNEIEIINSIINHQLKGDRDTFEKELSEIISEFKKGLHKKLEKEDYEVHYNLGIAFLEQGLYDEAVEELKIASKEKKIAVDCYSAISLSFKKANDFQEGMKWIEKGLDVAEKGSSQYYALKYEMASLYEDLEKPEKALRLYNEIRDWNDEFRDIAEKIKHLKRITSK